MFDNLTRRELIAMVAHQKGVIENLHKSLSKQEKAEPIIPDTAPEKRTIVDKTSAIGMSRIDFNEISAAPGFRELENPSLLFSINTNIENKNPISQDLAEVNIHHSNKKGLWDSFNFEKNKNSEDAEIDWSGTIVETKSGEEFKAFVDSLPEDTGTHYRFSYTVPIAPADLARGTITINLDPFRIAAIYGMQSFAAQTILKKVLCTGNRGHNSTKEDIDDIICACRRWLQMLEEDALLEQRISPPQKDQSQP